MASDYFCESCLLKDKSNAAVKLCSDCDERLCEECSVNHLGFKAFKLHHMILLSSMPAQIVSFQKYCSLHDNMELDFYCASHDTTCCHACIPKTHKSCEDVVPLKEASKDIQNSSFLTETLNELINIAHTLQTVLKSNETNMKKIDISANSIIQEITAHKRRLIKQLDDLEQKLIHNLSTTQNNLKTGMEETKIYVAEKMTEIEKRKHDLEFLKEHGTNNQLFLALHKYDQEINETGTKISEIISRCKDTDIHYDKTTIIIESLGKISETSRPCDVQYIPLKLKQAQIQSDRTLRSLTTFKREGEITLKKGEYYDITDIAVTGDNKLLLCNFNILSSKVYIYTDCKHYEKELTFSSPPYRIAVIPGTSRAVVTLLTEKSIQFFNTTTMIKEDKIKLKFQPLAVTASSEKIYIGGNNCVHVFDTKGVFQISISGIIYIYYIKLIKQNTEILCGGPEELCCVDLDGGVLYRYNVSSAAGIAVDGQGDVYVAQHYPSKVHRLSPEGKLREIILTEDDCINLPSAMTFNNDFSKMFIVDNDYTTLNCFGCS